MASLAVGKAMKQQPFDEKATGSGIREVRAFYALPECSVSKEQAKKQHGMTEAARLKAVRWRSLQQTPELAPTSFLEKLTTTITTTTTTTTTTIATIATIATLTTLTTITTITTGTTIPGHGQRFIITTLAPDPAQRDPRAKQPPGGGGY